MTIDEKRVLEVCESSWQLALGLKLERGNGDPSEPLITSVVNISGDWNGAIVVECPESLARHAAAMFFSVDTDNASKRELHDALNELTRIVGKSIQKQLPLPGKLSSPAVLNKGEQPDLFSKKRGVSELQLSCEGRPVKIVVLEDAPSAAA